ncbi:hypothetical protein ACIQ7N_22760 [Lysinibacillus sp. NPDC095746]|uniref:AMP-binding enzyme n=1 Tax=Lysinibacillus sp. NPDC095746 TaxID=3364134 RepID=UPI0038230105
MIEDGYFYFVDRIKDMIKRSGENVAARNEEYTNRASIIYEAAVIAVSDEIRDEAIKAYVILQEGANMSEEDLIAYVENALVKFKARTPVGKIQKHVLRNASFS